MATIVSTQSMSRDLSTLVALAEVLADPAKLKDLTEQLSTQAEIVQKAEKQAALDLQSVREDHKQLDSRIFELNRREQMIEAAEADLTKRQVEQANAERALAQAREQFKISVKEIQDRQHATDVELKQRAANFEATSSAKEEGLAIREKQLAAIETTLRQGRAQLDADVKSYNGKLAKLKELAG